MLTPFVVLATDSWMYTGCPSAFTPKKLTSQSAFCGELPGSVRRGIRQGALFHRGRCAVAERCGQRRGHLGQVAAQCVQLPVESTVAVMTGGFPSLSRPELYCGFVR